MFLFLKCNDALRELFSLLSGELAARIGERDNVYPGGSK
jgi:hypothetical protein